MSLFQPVIKWSGSKRTQSEVIKSYLPETFDVYYEPFIGGGSMLYSISPQRAYCGDICEPLISLWNMIKMDPERLSEAYRLRWTRLQEEGYEVFYQIRDNFNADPNPEDLLFLSRTCVNGLIRFNKNGEFNNSLHHTRPGISPNRLHNIILKWSERIQGANFIAQDYSFTTEEARNRDIVYLDPPYFHTKGRYYGSIDYQSFLKYLEDLNHRDIKFMLSFDGKREDKDYTVDLPEELYRRRILIPSGNSSFKKVIDKENQQVFESLYLNW